MGRQYSAYDEIRGAIDANYGSALSPVATVFGYGVVADYNGRIDNTIKFQSDNYSGFSAALEVGLGENKTATVDASQTSSLNLQYASGPIWVAYGYQQQKAQTLAAPIAPATVGLPNGTATTKYNVLGGTYDFGMAKLRAAYNTAEVSVNKDKEYLIGVEVPVGKAANVSFGYAKTTGEVSGTTTRSGSGVGVVGYYDLSVRTRLYAGLNQTKEDNNAGTDLKKTSDFQVGVRHKF